MWQWLVKWETHLINMCTLKYFKHNDLLVKWEKQRGLQEQEHIKRDVKYMSLKWIEMAEIFVASNQSRTYTWCNEDQVWLLVMYTYGFWLMTKSRLVTRWCCPYLSMSFPSSCFAAFHAHVKFLTDSNFAGDIAILFG